MFKMRLFDDKQDEEGKVVDIIAIRCIICNKKSLYLTNSTIEEIMTKFLLNAILHHVGMSWIICSNEEMFYEVDKSNNYYCLNKGPWYNTDIC